MAEPGTFIEYEASLISTPAISSFSSVLPKTGILTDSSKSLTSTACPASPVELRVKDPPSSALPKTMEFFALKQLPGARMPNVNPKASMLFLDSMPLLARL